MQSEKVKKEAATVKREVRKRILTAITAGLGLVVALAWNDAIKAAIDAYFPKTSSTIWAQFIYAFILTVVVVALSLWLAKIFRESEEEKQEEKKNK